MKESVLLRENYLILHSVTMAKARKKKHKRMQFSLIYDVHRMEFT